MPRIDLIQPRGGTAAEWTSANPILEVREMGEETDTGKSKRGDGVTAWNALPYFGGDGAQNIQEVLTEGNEISAGTELIFKGVFGDATLSKTAEGLYIDSPDGVRFRGASDTNDVITSPDSWGVRGEVDYSSFSTGSPTDDEKIYAQRKYVDDAITNSTQNLQQVTEEGATTDVRTTFEGGINVGNETLGVIDFKPSAPFTEAIFYDGGSGSIGFIGSTLNILNGATSKGIVIDSDGLNFITGTTPSIGQVLAATDTLGQVEWTTVSGGSSPLTTKGDLYTYSTEDARLPVGTNGQVLSANSSEATGLEWVSSPILSVVKPATEVRVNDTTLTIDPDLQITLEANSFYSIDINIIYSAQSTPDIKFQLQVPTGATGNYSEIETPNPVSNLTDVLNKNGFGSTRRSVLLRCFIQTDEAGIFGLKWAQQVSNINGAFVYGTSNIIATKTG